jgi:cyclopropane fatty-acyl-phospholipid synthase-like methyltransferase
MNLDQLVTFRNQLQIAYDSSVIVTEIDKNYQRFINLTDKVDSEIQQRLLAIADEHKNVKQYLDTTSSNIFSLLSHAQEKIDLLAKKLFSNNYELELTCNSIETVRNVRKIARDENFELALKQRINLYSNWQYPALEIGCRDGEWTKYLVASDPLYIADSFDEFLVSAVQQFPDLYQGRVRKYKIVENCKIINLPSDQLGLIFSYNYFNYLSLDSIKQYLHQAMNWLRPGGKIIFTYNNADLPAAAAYAENFFMTYVPKTILQPMAESLGFETTFSYDANPAFSIIEFKKPGQLKSIKLSQTSGEIKTKN